MLVVLEYGDFFAQSLTTLLPTFLHSTHLSVAQIAIVGSISGLAGMPGSLAGGWLCDKLGRCGTFRALFAVIRIPVVVTFTVPDFAVMVIAWTAFGLINGALGVPLRYSRPSSTRRTCGPRVTASPTTSAPWAARSARRSRLSCRRR
jgi:MFS family permease